MKALKITYWTTTILISLMMLMSAIMYFTKPEIAAGFKMMGFNDAFRIELGVAKFLGAIVLLIPMFPRLKEWAYFGFFLTFVSALIAHLSIGDTNVAGVVVAFLLLTTSYVTYHRIAKAKTGTAVIK
jgi:hypothetical protein